MTNMADAVGFALYGQSPGRIIKGEYLPRLLGLPGEKIKWIGNVTVKDNDGASTFLVRGHATTIYTDVYLGISPHRLILFKKWLVNQQCRSFWFNLDMEGYLWEPKKLFKKKRYKDIYLEISQKKGTMGPKLDVAYKGVSTEGKVDNLAGFMRFTAIKGIDFSTGKAKKSLAEQTIADLFTIYNEKKQPVGLNALKILKFEPEKLSSVKLGSREKSSTATDDSDSRPAEPSQPVCPRCGNPIKPGATFCGQCSHKFKKQEPTFPKQEKKMASSKKAPAPVSEEKPSTPSEPSASEEKKCPSCGRTVLPEWKVCPYCTASLPRTCPNCHMDLQSEWVACPYCGVKI